jgi:hypothetical protein
MEKMTSTVQVEGYEDWNAEQLADYFESKGLGDYREVLYYHKITGKIAPNLTDQDLKDIGVKIVGDRCRFRNQIKSLKRKARHVQRNKLYWAGKERIFFGCAEWAVGTCLGLFPEDPSTYKLTSSHLKIRTVDPVRIGPFRLCCCAKYSTNNIDLSQVDDVDMEGIPAPFIQQCLCCAEGKEILEVSTAEGDIDIVLKAGLGDEVSSLIMNQVEECQMMDRDL